MLERDGGRKASRKFAASSALEMSFSQTNDPQQGARLVRAYLTDRQIVRRSRMKAPC
jgi:hypothetical protein